MPQQLRWRAYGSTGDWATQDIEIAFGGSVDIESLTMLPDGDAVLWNVKQYQGYGKHHLDTEINEWFGTWTTGTSSTHTCVANGKVYLTGYPNGPLFEYIPENAWYQLGPAAGKNPRKLGNFSNGTSFSGIKRAEVLLYGAVRDRLYQCGLADRTGFAAGVGNYNFVGTPKFGGHNTGLEFYDGELGLVLLESIGRIVFGGTMTDNPSYPGLTPDEAELVIYDLDLVEITRQLPVAFMIGTGRLYNAGADPTSVVGLSSTGFLLYRWDITGSGSMIDSVDLSGVDIGVSAQNGTGKIVAVLDNDLVSINSTTLAITVLGDLTDTVAAYGGIDCITIVSDTDFFLSAGPNLLRATMESV